MAPGRGVRRLGSASCRTDHLSPQADGGLEDGRRCVCLCVCAHTRVQTWVPGPRTCVTSCLPFFLPLTSFIHFTALRFFFQNTDWSIYLSYWRSFSGSHTLWSGTQVPQHGWTVQVSFYFTAVTYQLMGPKASWPSQMVGQAGPLDLRSKGPDSRSLCLTSLSLSPAASFLPLWNGALAWQEAHSQQIILPTGLTSLNSTLNTSKAGL